MTPDRSLDKRYLEFSTKSQAAFSAYPQLEPLRLFVFKELLVRRRTDGWWQHAAHWLRPLRRRGGPGPPHPAPPPPSPRGAPGGGRGGGGSLFPARGGRGGGGVALPHGGG